MQQKLYISLLLLLSSSYSLTNAFVAVPPLSQQQRSLTSTTSIHMSTTQTDVKSMRAGEIKKELESYGISTAAFLEKSELVVALEKARADGMKPIKEVKEEPKRPSGRTTTRTSSTASSSSSSTTTSSSSNTKSTTSTTDTRPRDERLKEEMEKINKNMKASEIKKELQNLGISTKSLFEKSEFVKALAEARVDGVKQNNGGTDEEGYAEYKDVEVLTDDFTGPRKRSQEAAQQQQQSRAGSSPFGGSAGANPFGGGGMGGMGGMGGIADMLKNMGMGGAGGATASNPFGGAGGNPFGAGNPFGGGAGGANPFGGAGGDVMGKAQEMMSNPKVRELMAKAQSNPRIMAKVNECMSNPAAFAKYQNDPEVSELITELRKYM